MCWSAKWLGDKKIMSDYAFRYKEDFKSDKKDFTVCKTIHALLCKADIVVAHNGDNFDLKKLNSFFKKNDIPPVKPFYTVDTKKVSKSNFGFISNKLDSLCRELEIGSKIDNGGIDLWKRCMDGDQSAWNKMLRYNKHDVRLLEELYLSIRPYMKKHPNVSILRGDNINCPVCGSSEKVLSGKQRSLSGMIQRYQCKSCNHYYRSSYRLKTSSSLPDVSKNSN